MKKAILILIVLITGSSFAQTVNVEWQQKVNSQDTLKMLQGTWDLKHLLVGDRKDKVFYVSQLLIEKENFRMNFTETNSGGQIISTEQFRFKFSTGDCVGSKASELNWWCEDMVIFKLTKHELVLLRRNEPAKNYFRSMEGNLDVLYCYKRSQ